MPDTHDVFISYHGTANVAAAEKVCRHLETEGFHAGSTTRSTGRDDFGSGIVNAIQDYSVLVLIFSAAANGSKHSARTGTRRDEKTVLPIRIEDVLPRQLCLPRGAHWLDAFGVGIGGPFEGW
jgi:hypothetical protein